MGFSKECLKDFSKILPVTPTPQYKDFFYKGKFGKTTTDIVIESERVIIPKGSLFVIEGFDRNRDMVELVFNLGDNKMGTFRFRIDTMINSTVEVPPKMDAYKK